MADEGPWSDTPASWPDVPTGLLAVATGRVLTALSTTGVRPVQERLAAYYDVDGDDAGSTFTELAPADPYDVTAADVLAAQLLGVAVGPAVTRRFLDHGANRSEILAALRQVACEDLLVAGPSTLLRMETLHLAVTGALSADRAPGADRSVAASGLCARKRPELFPVRHGDVSEYLGLGAGSSHRIDWQVYRHLIGDRDVFRALDAARRETISAGGGRRLRVDIYRLRLLDAALRTYTRAPDRSERAEVGAAVGAGSVL